MLRVYRGLIAAACFGATALAHAQGQVNIICSVPIPRS